MAYSIRGTTHARIPLTLFVRRHHGGTAEPSNTSSRRAGHPPLPPTAVRPPSIAHTHWDHHYKARTHAWDIAQPAPPLLQLLRHRSHLLPNTVDATGRRRRAYVPGCGLGHDVWAIAEFGYDVVGGDMAPSATASNQARLNNAASLSIHEQAVASRVTFETHDFFTHNNQYHLVYDYTFFCALCPSRRQDWAKQMRSLLHPNVGRLVCLMFPVVEPGTDDGRGPPYGVSREAYREVLREVGVGEVEGGWWGVKNSVRGRVGLEEMGLFGVE